MVNKSTLRILNNIAFGADIDSLESYLINFKQASMICDLHRDTKRYNMLYSFLRDMKGNSLLFSDRTDIRSVNKNDTDILFNKYPNSFLDTAYGTDSDIIIELEQRIKHKYTNNVGIVALANMCGLFIKCVYVEGYLREAYIISDTEKYMDITEIANEILPEYITELKHYKLAEIRGKVITSKVEHLIPECSTLHFIKNKYNINTLQVYMHDILINAEELPYGNYWSKLEYLEELGFKVPVHVLVLDITSNSLCDAITEMDNYIYENEKSLHKYFGIQVSINDIQYKNNQNSIIYVSRNCDEYKTFRSKLKSASYDITNDGIPVTLNIVPVQCNDNVIIDKVTVSDIYSIELQMLKPGDEIKFQLLNNEAYLLD